MASPAPILVPTLEELAGEFDRLLAVHRVAAAACDADPANLALDEEAADACAALGDVCHAIGRLPAQNAEHIRLKARALDWCAWPDGGEPADLSERLAYQLVRALLDGVPS